MRRNCSVKYPQALMVPLVLGRLFLKSRKAKLCLFTESCNTLIISVIISFNVNKLNKFHNKFHNFHDDNRQ